MKRFWSYPEGGLKVAPSSFFAPAPGPRIDAEGCAVLDLLLLIPSLQREPPLARVWWWGPCVDWDGARWEIEGSAGILRFGSVEDSDTCVPCERGSQEGQILQARRVPGLGLHTTAPEAARLAIASLMRRPATTCWELPCTPTLVVQDFDGD